MLSALDGYLIVVAALVVYAVVLLLLHRRGLLGPDRALSLLGPALMMKTRLGLSLLDRAGRFRRAWSRLSDLGILLAGVAMALVVGVLLLDSVVVLSVPASAAPQPSEALGIPGINPIIPLGYGVAALVVGIVLHELMHGVIARSQGIKVRSVGVLWFVIPVGAFVEPDEEEMSSAPRRKRARVAAAGVLANFALTVVFFLLLAALVSSSVAPNANGVGVAEVLPGFPASNVSLAAGDIITSVNGTPTPTYAALTDALALTHPNETVMLDYYDTATGRSVATPVTLTDAASYTHVPADASRGFLGFSATLLTPEQLKGVLVNPWVVGGGAVTGAILWIVLPLASLEPVQGTSMGFFHLTGPLAALGTGGFWLLANLLFWLAWMNVLLGLSNALPLIPLDGGLLFRDFASWVGAKLHRTWTPERAEKFGGSAAWASSGLVLFLLLWQFVGPRL